jgi:murein DD-endopeptidase MepM/ murein hydrolase activator NlpD
VSSTSARHRRPSRRLAAAPAAHPARHRKRTSTTARALRFKPGRIGVAAGTSLVVVLAAAAAAIYWPAQAPRALGQVNALARLQPGRAAARARPAHQVTERPLANSARPGPASQPASTGLHAPIPRVAGSLHRPKPQRPAAPVYRNPLRSVAGLLPERIDMGADFGGTGPVYAIGNAVVTNATGTNYGWPGGGWITYRLTSGPAAGLMVFLAEDVTPTVSVGQQVTSGTVIANMYAGGAGIETGWAMPDGFSAESQLPVAGPVSGGGPFPTRIGINFDGLLQALGVPAGPNSGQYAYGLLPANYPASWATLLSRR